MTDTQRKVLAYLVRFFDEQDQLPPTRYIQKHFGWKSQTQACNVLRDLERLGMIERNVVGRFRFPRKISD